ncbi:MAG: hypothetical protein ACTSSH_05050 [Candidatus Heimdallarchaeota archaeon]
MSTDEKAEKAKSMFESRFMSIVLMLVLFIMSSLFIVIVWTFFGKEAAIGVIQYLSIGIGGGIVITLGILLITRTRKSNISRNVLVYLVGSVLVISLIVSLILKYTIADEVLSNWAFIYASSVGLGLTSGIAIFYLILAMFKSKLVSDKEPESSTKEISELKDDENEADINK